MRIVAGQAKGRRLTGPVDGTRPTSDRARESLFNSLRQWLDLEGSHVLDLYAGTGAVGLEAMSHGAASAVFVESDRRAAEVLRRNIDMVGLPGAQIVRRPVEKVVAEPAARSADLVFLDPPYALDDATVVDVLSGLLDHGWLAPSSIIVLERSARGAPVSWPDGIAPEQHRRYGEGVLWYGRRR
ncbi:MAG: 16S rRNA (guanine(966)-N(2))-methyltransferase RsmD [Jatrophihabitans sp.]